MNCINNIAYRYTANILNIYIYLYIIHIYVITEVSNVTLNKIMLHKNKKTKSLRMS